MRFGMQFYPLPAAPQTAAYAKRAMSQYPFARLWVPDHLTHENPFVTLAAILAETRADVGTSVTNPVCRTPVDLASSFSALAHLAGDQSVTAGIGAGSSSSDMIRKQHRVGMLREMILFLREMFGGRRVKWEEFPDLADFFRLDPAAEAFLRVPPQRPPEIFVAAAGPKTRKIAGDLGDGLILSNLSFPTALIRQGALAEAFANFQPRARAFYQSAALAHLGGARRQGGAAILPAHGRQRLDRRSLAEPTAARAAGAGMLRAAGHSRTAIGRARPLKSSTR